MHQREKTPRRILICVGHYPSPYKPYYDTQIAEFVRNGYEVQIVAAPPLDSVTNEKVVKHGLVERTRYYPVDGSHASLGMFGRLLQQPIAAMRFLSVRRGVGLRRKAGDLLRMLALPRWQPDAVLVHELGVALTLNWLREWYPTVPMAMYYHGGEVPSVKALEAGDVTRTFADFDIVFTNTKFSSNQAIARGCSSEKVRTLPVGFDLSDYQPPSPRNYREDGKLRLLCLGRMSEEKGLDFAIEALKIVISSGRRDVHLSLAGDGYMRESLEGLVRRHGLEAHVTFLGALTAQQASSALGETDALVLSSYSYGNCVETQACAVQEAMLMKAVVVTTRTGGVPESIPAEMRMLSVEERNAADMAQAICSVYDMPDSELRVLGEAGRAFVAERYDIRMLNQKMLTELWTHSNTN